MNWHTLYILHNICPSFYQVRRYHRLFSFTPPCRIEVHILTYHAHQLQVSCMMQHTGVRRVHAMESRFHASSHSDTGCCWRQIRSAAAWNKHQLPDTFRSVSSEQGRPSTPDCNEISPHNGDCCIATVIACYIVAWDLRARILELVFSYTRTASLCRKRQCDLENDITLVCEMVWW